MLWLALLGSVTAGCGRARRWGGVLRVPRRGFTDRYDDCAGRPGRPPDLRRRGASPVLEVDVDAIARPDGGQPRGLFPRVSHAPCPTAPPRRRPPPRPFWLAQRRLLTS